MKKIQTVPSSSITWQSQAEQYPRLGKSGIEYIKGNLDEFRWVDCLLYYNEQNELVGILNHYPFKVTYEQKGNINVFVKPSEQCKGIGKALLKEAIARWNINLYQQKYTPSGLKMLKSFKKTVDK